MISRTTSGFRKSFATLPAPIQDRARQAYRRFRENPQHPGLRFKKVHPSLPIYAARVGLGYRAVGIIEGDTVIWFWIGPHDEYDRLLQEL